MAVLVLSGRERSRRVIDIIAHQVGMFCPRDRRKKILEIAERERRLFWAKEASRIKRTPGPVGELLLLEACVYRCVSAIKTHINNWS